MSGEACLRTRWFIRAGVILIAIVVVASAGALGYRTLRQAQNARALAIHSKNGIEEAGLVPVGGMDQWVQIRGEDKSNPVLLFLHGGPGASETPLSSLFRNWERSFTVVMWDQRCAGKTFVRNGKASCAGLSVKRVAQDGIQLAQYLKTRFHQKKIVLLGHSWGTMVAADMVHERPDLFSAYVATGLVVSEAEKEPLIYARTMEQLRGAHDEEGVRKLSAIHWPYHSPHDIGIERELSARHDIPSERDIFSNMTPVVAYAPGWSLWDIYQFLQAPNAAEDVAFAGVMRFDARTLGRTTTVPFFVFQGEEDTITPTDLARAYFDWIAAPEKAFVSFEGFGHTAVLNAPDLFLKALVTKVRPVAVEDEGKTAGPSGS